MLNKFGKEYLAEAFSIGATESTLGRNVKSVPHTELQNLFQTD